MKKLSILAMGLILVFSPILTNLKADIFTPEQMQELAGRIRNLLQIQQQVEPKSFQGTLKKLLAASLKQALRETPPPIQLQILAQAFQQVPQTVQQLLQPEKNQSEMLQEALREALDRISKDVQDELQAVEATSTAIAPAKAKAKAEAKAAAAAVAKAKAATAKAKAKAQQVSLIPGKKVLNITRYVLDHKGQLPAQIYTADKVGDPAPGMAKNLVVYYKNQGPKSYTDTDLGNAIIIPNPEMITNVYYGIPSEIPTEVQQQAEQQVQPVSLIPGKKVFNITRYVLDHKGQLPAQIYYSKEVGDPAPGIAKNLKVYYKNQDPKSYTDADLGNAIIIPNPEMITNVYYGIPAEIPAQ